MDGSAADLPERLRGGPYAVLWSGGKDSCLALWRSRRLGLSVAALVNFFDESSGRVRFHAVRRYLIAGQAAALELALLQLPTLPETYEAVYREALALLKARGFVGVIGGDIHLEDVRAWVEARVLEAGLCLVEPLWQQDGAELLRELVGAGFRAVLTCCDSTRLDTSWLGRQIDQSFIAEILALAGVDPCGERGEYHSFVFNGPGFRRPVSWRAGERRQQDEFIQLDLLQVDLPPGQPAVLGAALSAARRPGRARH
jgi:diphthine-ammonia ligase